MSDQVKFTQRLKGDKVLLIGGSSGLGFGVAEACVEHGCQVIISSSSQSKVDAAVARLRAAYPSHAAAGNILGVTVDLADQAHLDANIAALFAHVGSGIDHIVFTAADSLSLMPLSSIDMAKVQKAGTIRFFAPLFVAKHAPQYMKQDPKSSFTITTGSVSERPRKDWSVVNSFATGLQGMTRGLALDMKPVRVNCVSPGVVMTELWEGLEEAQRQKLFTEAAEATLVGRVGRVEDVAECYLYLMKDHNTTGIMVSSNGGHTIV